MKNRKKERKKEKKKKGKKEKKDFMSAKQRERKKRRKRDFMSALHGLFNITNWWKRESEMKRNRVIGEEKTYFARNRHLESYSIPTISAMFIRARMLLFLRYSSTSFGFTISLSGTAKCSLMRVLTSGDRDAKSVLEYLILQSKGEKKKNSLFFF
jgi:hypothetical protein